MKNIQLFDFNLQYPIHIDGETLVNREAYATFLIRKGYAYDPFMPVDPNIDAVNAEVEETLPLVSGEPVEKMFDAIEDSAKKTFARGRKKKTEGEA